MMQKNQKKKWYEEWWGALWTLAIVDAHPGQGVRVFMEVDRDMQRLTDFSDEKPIRQPFTTRPSSISECKPCPTVL